MKKLIKKVIRIYANAFNETYGRAMKIGVNPIF